MTKAFPTCAQRQPTFAGLLSAAPAVTASALPLGTILYWIVIICLLIELAYVVLFKATPFIGRSLRSFGARVSETLNTKKITPVIPASAAPVEVPIGVPVLTRAVSPTEPPRVYSSYDGFKSFAHDGALAIEDIVKGLSKEHSIQQVDDPVATPVQLVPKAKPIQEYVEPAVSASFESAVAPVVALPIKIDKPIELIEIASMPTVQSMAASLVVGDKDAVFADLREFARGGGKPESLISSVVFLIDDAYQARIDGSSCESAVARLTARLDTSTLEKLIAALTTAIGSSYSDSMTGVKLALTRALAVLGA